MQARFDSFNRFETPNITLCKPGATYEDGVVTKSLGVLTHISDVELVANFNELSELNFVVHKTNSSVDPYDLYDKTKDHQYIFIDDVGFFCVSQIDEQIEGNVSYKSVKAESAEVELQNKTMPGDFYNESEITNAEFIATYEFSDLMELLLRSIPLWTISSIDPALVGMYRTFEDISEDTNILSFMLQNVQDAYECIFVFDILNREISVYDQNNYVRKTSIHLSKDDLLNSIQISSNSENIYTALRVMSSEDDFSVSPANPTGSSVIYRFNYYFDAMDTALAQKVATWQNTIDGYESSYTFNTEKVFEYSQLATEKRMDIDALTHNIEMYNKCRNNAVVASGLSDSGVVGYIVSNDTADYVSSCVDEINEALEDVGGDTPEIIVQFVYGEELTVSSYVFGDIRAIAEMTYFAKDDKVVSVYKMDEDGIYTEKLIHTDGELTPGHFHYDAQGKELWFSSDLSAGDKIAVFYTPTDTSVETPDIDITDLLNTIDTELNALNGELTIAESDLQQILDDMQVYVTARDNIINEVKIDEFFTQSELSELSMYIFEGQYSDEYLIITDDMTLQEEFDQYKQMYDRAKNQLLKVSEPTEEFSIDVDNFIFQSKFLPFTTQLETGVLVAVEVRDNDVADLFLSNFTVNYEDQSLSMTFGNRYNKFDSKSLFEDLLGNIKRTSNSVSFIKDLVYPIRNGELDSMKQAIKDIRTLSAGAALSSNNQDFTIDSTGITGLRLDSNGEPENEQLKIINNMIAMTDDGWDTCSLALGKMDVGGVSYYGINAEVLIGDLILGSQLKIINADGSLSFDDAGLLITNGTNSFAVDPSNVQLLSVKKGTSDLMYLDSSGEMHISNSVVIGGSGGTSIGSALTDAAKTATNYIEANASGIKIIDGIHNSNWISLDSYGMSIWQNNVNIANYASSLRLGVETQAHVNIASGSISLIDNQQNIGVFETYAETRQDDTDIEGSRIKFFDGYLEVGAENLYQTFPTIGRRLISRVGKFHVNDPNGVGGIDIETTDGQGNTYTINMSSISNAMGFFVVDNQNYHRTSMTLGLNNIGIDAIGEVGIGADTYAYITGGSSVYIGSPTIATLRGNNTYVELLTTSGSYVYNAMRAETNDSVYLGDTSHRWKTVYLVTSPNVNSDKNQKHDIKNIEHKYDTFFDLLQPRSYMRNGGDRVHIGVVAQEVEESLLSAGLTPMDFAGFCKDVQLDENGNELYKNNELQYAHSIRYEEFIMLNTWQIQKLKSRVKELEDIIVKMQGE